MNESWSFDEKTSETMDLYCKKGERSQFLRDCVKFFHEYQQNHNKKQYFFQTFFFLILGIALLGLALGTLINMLVAINTIFLVMSSIVLFTQVYLNVKKYKKTNRNVLKMEV